MNGVQIKFHESVTRERHTREVELWIAVYAAAARDPLMQDRGCARKADDAVLEFRRRLEDEEKREPMPRPVGPRDVGP